MGETVWLKINDRTHIEVAASLTEDERKKSGKLSRKYWSQIVKAIKYKR